MKTDPKLLSSPQHYIYTIRVYLKPPGTPYRTTEMSASMDDWKEQLRAQVSERVMRYGNEPTMTEVIVIIISHHEDVISALKYDNTLAQNQSTANTLVCREIKADLGEGSRATSD